MSGAYETLEDLSVPCFKMKSPIQMGPVCMRVRNLDASLDFYQKMGFEKLDVSTPIGLYLEDFDSFKSVAIGLKRRDYSMEMPILILKHDPHAVVCSPKVAGMSHFAILLPDRKSLAYNYLYLKQENFVFERFACQFVKEAIYLRDPENNGIEFYSDTPKETWRYDEKGGLIMGLVPLDFDSLLGELSSNEKNDPLPFYRGGKLGHLQLKCRDMKKSILFYHNLLGLDITHMIPHTYTDKMLAFTSVGGYHHHIALNTLESFNGEPYEKGHAGLEYFTVIVPDEGVLNDLGKHLRVFYNPNRFKREGCRLWILDPDNIAVLIVAQS